MFTRIRNALGLSLLLALILVIPVFAGGWATITLDELPTDIVADEPVTVGFTVLQHGKTPLDGLDPTITANLYKEQEFVVHAEPGDKPGYYTATLTFPKEGDWQWSIQAFGMDQPMPVLTVSPAGSVVSNLVTKSEPVTSSLSPMSLAGGLALIAGLVSGVLAIRSRSRQAALLAGIGLAAAIALFITGSGSASGVDAMAKSEASAVDSSSASQVEFGRELFIAKGCITCHYNSKAGSPSEYLTIEMGAPNLSKFSADPIVIETRLKDPSSAKSDTKMPNLDLTKVEIDALVAFINSK